MCLPFQYINIIRWCEHDPLIIWKTVEECIIAAVKDAEVKHGPIAVKALGITNQRETTVVWHRHTGQPLCNAIVWLDVRTRDLCSRMTEELGSKDFFRAVTGLPISTYFSGFKYKWMYENVRASPPLCHELSGIASFFLLHIRLPLVLSPAL